MTRIIFLLIYCLIPGFAIAQYNWQLEKEKNGIQVYSSDVPYSAIKAFKVECTLDGNYEKLISILADVKENSKWVYHIKTSLLLETFSKLDVVYYAETSMPWPMSDRDAIIHLVFNTDSLPKYMTVTGTSEPERVPVKSNFVRMIHYTAIWNVTMPTQDSIHIEYILEMNPAGNIPSWFTNMFAKKGPYETFRNLAVKLSEDK